jgi:insertion element IS1 protein InsB
VEDKRFLLFKHLLNVGFNNTLRQRDSRLVRDALSFSKKLAHPMGAIKLFICHYNLTRAAA